VFPRKDLALGAPSNATLRTSLSRHSKSPRPRPPSTLTGHTAMFARCADKRFSGSGWRPTTSATPLPTRGHALEHPILAFPLAPQPCLPVEPRARLRSRRTFRARRPSPVEEGNRTLRAATIPPTPDPDAMQARTKTRPRILTLDRDAACGRRLDPTTVCGGGR
jgi:hypothetical protein